MMSYQLTADQWRIVALTYEYLRAEKPNLSIPGLAIELDLSEVEAASRVESLCELKVIYRDADSRLLRGENWPEEELLGYMRAWLIAAERPTKGPVEAKALAEILFYLSRDRYRTVWMRRRFKVYVREAVLFARRSGDDPIGALEREAGTLSPTNLDELARQAAYLEVLKYWKIRPPMPKK